MKKHLICILLSILLVGFGFLDLQAKGGGGGGGSSHSSFSGGGGSRSSSVSFSGSGGSRSSSSSFSGSGSKSSSSSSKSSYDSAARTGASHDSSKAKFDSYKSVNSPDYKSSGLASTRSSRESVAYNSYRPTGYYTPPSTVVIYRDNYSNSFLQVATTMWLFNHWNTVDKSRFEESKLRELEAKVKEMERQNIKRDPNYVQPGVDPDLMYQAPKEEGSSFWVWFFIIVVALSVIGGGSYFLLRRRT